MRPSLLPVIKKVRPQVRWRIREWTRVSESWSFAAPRMQPRHTDAPARQVATLSSSRWINTENTFARKDPKRV
jgi:hypothetical protein